MTYKQALVKAASFCAYQERTRQEVRDKVADWELEPAEIEQLLDDLVKQKFIDEERFAKAYVRAKYSQRRWGRRLIMQGLREKRLPDACIRVAMAEIDPDVYWDNLLALAQKKARSLTGEPHPLKRKAKLLTHLAIKGYESDLARDAAAHVLGTSAGADETELDD